MTVSMVVREFVRRRIAPLQCHSRPMWAFTGPNDTMMLQVPSLPSKTLCTVLELLMGDPAPAVLPAEGFLLYNCSNREAFVEKMLGFDEWGLLPEGHEGPRENPILVAPVLVDLVARPCKVVVGGSAPEVAGGEQAPPNAPEVAARGQAPPNDVEVPARDPADSTGEPHPWLQLPPPPPGVASHPSALPF